MAKWCVKSMQSIRLIICCRELKVGVWAIKRKLKKKCLFFRLLSEQTRYRTLTFFGQKYFLLPTLTSIPCANRLLYSYQRLRVLWIIVSRNIWKTIYRPGGNTSFDLISIAFHVQFKSQNFFVPGFRYDIENKMEIVKASIKNIHQCCSKQVRQYAECGSYENKFSWYCNFKVWIAQIFVIKHYKTLKYDKSLLKVGHQSVFSQKEG